MRIGQISSGAEYRIDEPFKNMKIFGILMVFWMEKILNIF